MSDQWFSARGGKQSGPMSLEELRRVLAREANLAEVLVWHEGLDRWVAAPLVPELYPSLTPPPLPALSVLDQLHRFFGPRAAPLDRTGRFALFGLLCLVIIIVVYAGHPSPTRLAETPKDRHENEPTALKVTSGLPDGESDSGASATAPLSQSTLCDGKNAIKPVDARKLAAILRAGDFHKGEFETAEQFKKRVSAAVNKAEKFLIASSGVGELVLTIPISADNIKYDADRANMTAKILHNDNVDLGGVRILESTDPVDTSSISKAYGYGGTNYAAPNWKGGAATVWDLSLASPRDFVHSSFELKVPPNEARQVKNALVLLVVGKLKAPYFPHDHRVLSFGGVRVTELIHADISCSALYDSSRKKVLLNVDPAKL